MPRVIEHHVDDQPPQFGLRALFFATTALSAVFALIHWVGPAWGLSLGLLLCLISAHVAGAALGTKLRERADRATREARSQHQVEQSQRGPWIAQTTASRLTERTGVSWLAIGISLLAACGGGCLGGWLATVAYGADLSAAAMTLAVCSAAVLGGFGGFLLGSFLWVAARAWREALDRDRRPSR